MKPRILKSRLGVFAAIAKVEAGELKILVNVRTDQAKQRKAANLPKDSTINIVDLPGGTADDEDPTQLDALLREIEEELKISRGKVTIHGPLHLLATVNIDFAKTEQNIAMVWPVEIDDEPQTSDETSQNLWVTEEEITKGDIVRCLGPNKFGRMFQMMKAGFKYWGDVHYDQTMSAKSGN